MKSQWDELIQKQIDGFATVVEAELLITAMQSDPSVQRLYLEYLMLDLALHAEAGLIKTEPMALATRFIVATHPVVRWMTLAACVSVAVGCVWFWVGSTKQFATVVRSVGMLADQSQSIGQETRDVLTGTLELVTNDGARVVVEAPAKFRFESAKRMYLVSGRLSADVPESAHGFTVVTSGGLVKDMGTVFGVDADARDGAEVHVFDGEVIAQSREKRTLVTGDAARMRGNELEHLQFRDSAFIKPDENTALFEGRRRGQQDRCETLKQLYMTDPSLLVWESFDDPETLGKEGNFRRVQGRFPGSHALEFVDKGDYTVMDANGETMKFTILAWVRLDSLPEGMQSIYHGRRDYDQQTGVVHWMFRNGGKNMILPVSGTNRVGVEFDKLDDKILMYPASKLSGRDTVGNWALVGVTYDADTGSVRFYYNGDLDNEDQVNPRVAAVFGPARIGNWHQEERLLSGRLDDIVIFQRVFTDHEMTSFYSQTKPY